MLTPCEGSQHQARSPEKVMDVSEVKMPDAARVSLCIQTLTLRLKSVSLSYLRDVPWNASPWKLPVDVPKSFLEVFTVAQKLKSTLQPVFEFPRICLKASFTKRCGRLCE